jgi:hypothetical protein
VWAENLILAGSNFRRSAGRTKEYLATNTAIAGFYSYGELSPFNPGSNCELHNQTMTITTFTEL